MQSPPVGWGKDKLSDFIDVATNNSFATFHNKKTEYELLEEIDSYFELIITNLTGRSEILVSMLFARAHSTYRGAVRLAISGQCPEAFSLLRTAIECSIYALRIYKNPYLVEVWLNRHENDASLTKAKSEFSYSKALLTLESSDKNHADKINLLYQRCIDFGAHPNEMSVTGNMEINQLNNTHEFLQKYLVGDSDSLDHVLKSTAQIGFGVLYVFRLIYRERFDLLEITYKLDALKARL